MDRGEPKEQLDLASALSRQVAPPSTVRALRHATMNLPLSRLKVGFLLAPNFTLLTFSGFIETLRQLWDDGRRTSEELCSWEVLAADQNTITSSCGLKVMPSKLLDDPRQFNYIVVVGGQIPTTVPLDPRIVTFLRQAARFKIPLIGVCTGTFELARAGLLDGRTACIHWYHHREFIDEFPNVKAITNKIFLIDGDRITCAGGTAAIDLAAHLISEHFGELRATRALSLMGIQQRRLGNHYQARFFDGVDFIHDDLVTKAIQVIETTMSDPPTVEHIARLSGASVRQLERKFHDVFGMGPAEISRALRLRYGHWLVQHTRRSITEIAYECGFADGSHFARHFRHSFGGTPTEVRGH